jgi:hypothetical protein
VSEHEARARRVAEALEWLQEDGGKFPGWVVDPRVDGALLESYLLIYPQLAVIPALADMRTRWLPQGKATTKAWRARLRNWLKCGVRFGDPLVVGPRPSPTPRPAMGGPGPGVRAIPRPPAGPTVAAETVRTWREEPWARMCE